MAASLVHENWWIAFRSPNDIWEEQRSLLLGEILYYLVGLLSLRHALQSGGRFPYLWFGIIIYALTIEVISYNAPDINNYWYAQSMVMLLGKRLPLHIPFTYVCLMYTASVAVSRSRLPLWAAPFAVGLCNVLMDIPLDLMGTKMVWWTFHDTDPNLFDRFYWVSWNSFYFHIAFPCSFTFLFHSLRSLVSVKERFQAEGFLTELLCCVLAGLLCMPLGTLQFLPVYHILHDNYNIHTEVCLFLVVGFYVMVWWTGDRNPGARARTPPNKGWLDEVGLCVFLHYGLLLSLAYIETPENVRATSLHQKVGECNVTTDHHTAFGQVLKKNAFFCISDYDEGYFDFHCTQPPKDGQNWYTVCGTPFKNWIEYCVVVSAFVCLGLYVFVQLLAYSGQQPRTAIKRTGISQKHKKQ